MPDLEQSRHEYIGRVNRVIDYIKDNLHGDLSLEQLARVATFSPFYFHRIFGAIAGETLNQFILRTRLERAAFQLSFSRRKTITTVALDCGFSGSATFSRAFRNAYGMSATEWRQNPAGNYRKNRKTNGNECKAVSGTRFYFDPQQNTLNWRIKMSDKLKVDVQVKNLPELNVAYVRHRGYYRPDDAVLFQGLFRRLLTWAAPRGFVQFPKTQALTVYSSGHPDVTPSERLAVDVCITIPEGTPVDGEIGTRKISGGQYAVTRMEATIQECGEAWNYVFKQWLPESGLQPDDGAYYLNHLNDPQQHPQKLHIVEMCLPVKPL